MKRFFYYVTHWETWHWFAKYIIIGPAWLWLCIKAKSPWFFTASNPAIEFGGFLGETKSEVYKNLPEGSYPKSIYISPQHSIEQIERAISMSGLQYPVAVKPDIGMMGFMFRKVGSLKHLRQYHSVMPVNYIVQEFIDYPLEISVFYYRLPGQEKGIISGLVKKEAMEVTGDGKSTLKELIEKYPRAQFRRKELFSKHKAKLNEIIHDGEHFVLSDALNLSRGGRLVNLNHEIDEQLVGLFDQYSRNGNFYYGRYDIRCRSINELKQGKNFSILEFNGCGGEPHHVYSGYSFLHACSILIKHWNILYKIAKLNSQEGVDQWSYRSGLEFLRKARQHFSNLAQLDNRFSFAVQETPKHVSRTIAPHITVGSTQLQKSVA